MIETFHRCPKNTVTWVVRITDVCDDVVVLIVCKIPIDVSFVKQAVKATGWITSINFKRKIMFSCNEIKANWREREREGTVFVYMTMFTWFVFNNRMIIE